MDRPSSEPAITVRMLTAFRKRWGLTQEGLGRLLGLSQSTVSNWEVGRTDIKNPTLLARAIRDLDRELEAARR